MKKLSDTDCADEIASACIGARLRVINRVITSVYDDALRPFGMKISQVNILVVASKLEMAAPSQIGAILKMDRSTISRNVERMKKNGWLKASSADDNRSHLLKVTAKGAKALNHILPAWREAQKKAVNILGKETASAIFERGNKIMINELEIE
jgi:DNA-binding MarR family transcriptional regulator